MNISLCSQSRAFQDAQEYQPQPFPVDRRVPVVAPGYETYVNTGYPGFTSFLTPFGWTQYAPVDPNTLPMNSVPLDEREDRLLPPLVFVNGKAVYIDAQPSTLPEFVSGENLNHQTMIPGSAQYSKLPRPVVDVCKDPITGQGAVLRQATDLSVDVWGTGSDFVLRRPMPNIFVNGKSAVPVTGNGEGLGAVPVLLIAGLALWALSSSN
jgi:hypothetical protein